MSAMPDKAGPNLVAEPTVEQYVYYQRLAEGDTPEARQGRQAALLQALGDVAAHMTTRLGDHVSGPDELRETPDPYLGEALARIDWHFTSDQARGCMATCSSYGDLYQLHVRYYRRGRFDAEAHTPLLQEELWLPEETAAFVGQAVVLAGSSALTSSHAAAAQVLRQHLPAGQGPGELQTCQLGSARLFRGSNYPGLNILLYPESAGERAVTRLVSNWLPRWFLHQRKLEAQLAWCLEVTGSVERDIAELTAAQRNGLFQSGDPTWRERHDHLQMQLATCLRRENALQSNLASLAWLLQQADVQGPDTFFAATLRALRERHQGFMADLVSWQRARDALGEALSPGANRAQLPFPARGDLSRIWLNSHLPQPVLADLAQARQMPPWLGQGWVGARSLYVAGTDRWPDWRERYYQSFEVVIAGLADDDRYKVQLTASALGQHTKVVPGADLLQQAARLDELEVSSAADRAHQIGQDLFEALFNDEALAIYRQALELARATNQGLRWQLAIDRAPELEGIPWECLYDPAERVHLAASAETPFGRYSVGARLSHDRLGGGPLRILFALANPHDALDRFHLPRWDSEAAFSLIAGAMAPWHEVGLVDYRVVEQATVQRICQENARFQPHVLACYTHAVMRGGRPYVLLENGRGRSRLCDVQALDGLFIEPYTRLVVLHAAEPASASNGRVLWELARKLHRVSSAGVLAFRQALDVPRQEVFWREFGRTVGAGNAIDVALAEVRRVMMRAAPEAALGVMLYMPGQPQAGPWRVTVRSESP